MQHTPRSIYEELVTLGEAWANAHAAAELLEENKKSVLAKLTITAKGNSQAAKEASALCEPDYEEHISKMVKARREANLAKVRYDSKKVFVELLRTKEVTERQASRHAP